MGLTLVLHLGQGGRELLRTMGRVYKSQRAIRAVTAMALGIFSFVLPTLRPSEYYLWHCLWHILMGWGYFELYDHLSGHFGTGGAASATSSGTSVGATNKGEWLFRSSGTSKRTGGDGWEGGLAPMGGTQEVLHHALRSLLAMGRLPEADGNKGGQPLIFRSGRAADKQRAAERGRSRGRLRADAGGAAGEARHRSRSRRAAGALSLRSAAGKSKSSRGALEQ